VGITNYYYILLYNQFLIEPWLLNNTFSHGLNVVLVHSFSERCRIMRPPEFGVLFQVNCLTILYSFVFILLVKT